LIRRNRSFISLLGLIIVIGSVLIITASGGILSQKEGINSLLSPGALMTLQINSVNTQIPITYQSNTPGKLSYTENSTACGYCDGNPYSPRYSDNPFVTPNLTPYYPPKILELPATRIYAPHSSYRSCPLLFGDLFGCRDNERV
jgi:hypothetical protein